MAVAVAEELRKDILAVAAVDGCRQVEQPDRSAADSASVDAEGSVVFEGFVTWHQGVSARLGHPAK